MKQTQQQDAAQAARPNQAHGVAGPQQSPANPASVQGHPFAALSSNSARVGVASAQRKAIADNGLPNTLKSGIETLSGMSMDHVKVHYNSQEPARINAHAYTQGSNIYVAPGQEKHLAHEAWHVVQQAQRRVRPTLQMKSGVQVNDDAGLETEADAMGTKAMSVTTMGASIQRVASEKGGHQENPALQKMISTGSVIQCFWAECTSEKLKGEVDGPDIGTDPDSEEKFYCRWISGDVDTNKYKKSGERTRQGKPVYKRIKDDSASIPEVKKAEPPSSVAPTKNAPLTSRSISEARSDGETNTLSKSAKRRAREQTRTATPEVKSSTFLSEEEFDGLASSGTIDSKQIRYSQDSIGYNFSKGKGGVYEFIEEAKRQPELLAAFPPIHIVRSPLKNTENQNLTKGVYSMDNRRLFVFKSLGEKVKYIKQMHLTLTDLQKVSTKNDGEEITVRPPPRRPPPKSGV